MFREKEKADSTSYRLFLGDKLGFGTCNLKFIREWL